MSCRKSSRIQEAAKRKLSRDSTKLSDYPTKKSELTSDVARNFKKTVKSSGTGKILANKECGLKFRKMTPKVLVPKVSFAEKAAPITTAAGVNSSDINKTVVMNNKNNLLEQENSPTMQLNQTLDCNSFNLNFPKATFGFPTASTLSPATTACPMTQTIIEANGTFYLINHTPQVVIPSTAFLTVPQQLAAVQETSVSLNHIPTQNTLPTLGVGIHQGPSSDVAPSKCAQKLDDKSKNDSSSSDDLEITQEKFSPKKKTVPTKYGVKTGDLIKSNSKPQVTSNNDLPNIKKNKRITKSKTAAKVNERDPVLSHDICHIKESLSSRGIEMKIVSTPPVNMKFADTPPEDVTTEPDSISCKTSITESVKEK